MKKTHEILGFTEHEYEMLILQLMLDWAGLYAKGCNRNTQMLLSSRKVTNWFRMELKNLLKGECNLNSVCVFLTLLQNLCKFKIRD